MISDIIMVCQKTKKKSKVHQLFVPKKNLGGIGRAYKSFELV